MSDDITDSDAASGANARMLWGADPREWSVPFSLTGKIRNGNQAGGCRTSTESGAGRWNVSAQSGGQWRFPPVVANLAALRGLWALEGPAAHSGQLKTNHPEWLARK